MKDDDPGLSYYPLCEGVYTGKIEYSGKYSLILPEIDAKLCVRPPEWGLITQPRASERSEHGRGLKLEKNMGHVDRMAP